MKGRTRGFTLVEIMIVVLIIAILLAIAVPNWNLARARSRASGLVSDLREIAQAKDEYVMAQGLRPGDPVDGPSVLVPQFIKAWPVGPIAAGTYEANPVNSNPTFLGYDETWYLQHCTGSTADSACPL